MIEVRYCVTGHGGVGNGGGLMRTQGQSSGIGVDRNAFQIRRAVREMARGREKSVGEGTHM